MPENTPYCNRFFSLPSKNHHWTDDTTTFIAHVSCENTMFSDILETPCSKAMFAKSLAASNVFFLSLHCPKCLRQLRTFPVSHFCSKTFWKTAKQSPDLRKKYNTLVPWWSQRVCSFWRTVGFSETYDKNGVDDDRWMTYTRKTDK